MDHGTPCLIYLDPRPTADLALTEHDVATGAPFDALPPNSRAELECNIKAFLSAFSQVYVCRSPASTLERLEAIQSDHHGAPTVIVVHASPERERLEALSRKNRSPSPYSNPVRGSSPAPTSTDLTGIHFLHHVVAERSSQQIFNYVTLIVILSAQEKAPISLLPSSERGRSEVASRDRFTAKSQYFLAGAVDVIQGPLNPERVQCLPAHALRTCNEFRARFPDAGPNNRRGSWTTMQHDSKQPYPYLRESMVSGLMDRICDPDYIEKPVNIKAFHVPPDREAAVSMAVGSWGFSAHDFSDDELTHACFLMLKHTLSMNGLEKWQLSDESLLTFILACRRVYNSFVIYHNFRHACDVLQATFFFLLSVGALPPYPAISASSPRSPPLPNGIAEEPDEATLQPANYRSTKTPLGSILRPFEAMTLIISALGHDVGHPGVNNLFLVTLNAPLAQLYNDRSVLESFHCAAFSQILRRYWSKAFEDVALRKLMINSILATDMSIHSNYINDLDKLNSEMEQNGAFASELSNGKLTDTRTLLCCLLIKCADISNVARKFSVAREWADILTDEFANQAKMESELDMASCLFGGPPVQNDMLKMGASQIGFMNIFGMPLFQKVAQALPSMQFAVEELQNNKATWEKVMEDTKKNKPNRDSSTASTPAAERTHSPHQHRRSSVIAQSQMRADPMVFGAHSSLNSPRAGKRHSAGSTSQLSNPALSPSRRASLGPTVIPSGLGTPTSASRRSSAGHGKTLLSASKLAEFQGTPGINATATTAVAAAREPNSPNTGLKSYETKSNSVAVSGEGIWNEPGIQELLKNPPDFTLRDPSTVPNTDGSGGSYSDTRRHSASGPARGRDKMPAATRVATADSPEPSNRSINSQQRRTRKFSLKFWRKSRSLDRSGGRDGS